MLRGMLACLVLLASGTVSIGTPLPDAVSSGSAKDRAEAQLFAMQLVEILRAVSEQYVRPVTIAELADAAVRGLYTAADQPAPVNLTAEMQKAGPNLYRLQRLIAANREELGDASSLREDKGIHVSLQAMIERLDPYCAVLPASKSRGIENEEMGAEAGLELMELSAPSATSSQPRANRDSGQDDGSGPLIIRSVTPGSAAQKAGLRPGDEIKLVDGQTPTRAALQHGGEFTVARAGLDGRLRVTVKPDISFPEMMWGIKRRADNSREYFADAKNKVAQIRIGTLKEGAAAELSQVLSELTEEHMRGLILDLRWCPGGTLDEARDIADLLLGDFDVSRYVHPVPGNLIALAELCGDHHYPSAVVQYREGRPDLHVKRGEGGFTNFPIVVLVNAETSGGAELIAAVLQDNRRAFIAGERTKGKASVQIEQRLGNLTRSPQKGVDPNTRLKLTVGMLSRPSGKNLHRFTESKISDDWGVRPDLPLEFRMSKELSQQLHSWWELQTLRPGSSKESLPLDDPLADPQRQAALRFLLGLLK
jgi:C-terminal processing protease CtpA/Prc